MIGTHAPDPYWYENIPGRIIHGDAEPGAGESVLEEAQRLIHGARRSDYGHPTVNHGRTAALWNAYLESRPAGPLTARDVCWFNVLQKISRDMHSSKRDNLVDAAGYTALIEIIDEGG